MGVGILISSLTCGDLELQTDLGVSTRFKRHENSYPHPSQFEVPWGGNFNILTLWRLQVSLKFHGGKNFHAV